MANKEIKQLLKTEKIAYWQIGEVLGVHENTICRKLRKELTSQEKEQFLQAISELKEKTA